jgi:hypothetical protein
MNFKRLPSPYKDMEVWGARSGSLTFVISCDKNIWSASVKTEGSRPFDGSRYDLGYMAYKSRSEAEAACKKFVKEKHA